MALEIGSVVEGKVTSIAKFGAFVLLPEGKSGLVHISEIANAYVSDVGEFVQVGQSVKVRVLSVSEEGKINLSIKRAEETGRDFAAFQPDWIVINLGTNDLSWCGTDEERGKKFAALYTCFLKTVRKDNPNARILCTLGVMGTGLNGMIRQAADTYRKETGDRQIRVLLLEEQDAARNGYGSDFHPNEITQRSLAGTVTEAIKEWMKV